MIDGLLTLAVIPASMTVVFLIAHVALNLASRRAPDGDGHE